MPKNRINFSDDFTLNNEKVGIGTTIASETLTVVGTSNLEGNLISSGISTLTGYDGFLISQHSILEDQTIESSKGVSRSLSDKLIVGSGVTVINGVGTTNTSGSLSGLKIKNTFMVPVGFTTDRPMNSKAGSLRFNRDFASLEFYDGERWREITSTTQRGRGIFGGGSNPTLFSAIEFVTIATTGNSSYFGDLSSARDQLSACSSEIYGVFGGHAFGAGDGYNTIDYVTIASTGNSQDFGDLTVARRQLGALSSSSRGLFCGGAFSPLHYNVIDYVEISTRGNALDFGDLITAGRSKTTCASSTRGIFGPSFPTSGTQIEFVTISTKGNATRFGDTIFNGGYMAGCSNATRGVFAGGSSPGTSYRDSYQYVTIATTGNAIYFGDLCFGVNGHAACASLTRGINGSGSPSPGVYSNYIEYITISTAGKGMDFGDLSGGGKSNPAACSDSHGGLGGF